MRSQKTCNIRTGIFSGSIILAIVIIALLIALLYQRMLGARYRETFEESSSNNQKYLSVVHTQPSHRVFIDDIEESITTDVMSVLAPLDAYGLTVVRGSNGPDALRKLEKERG